MPSRGARWLHLRPGELAPVAILIGWYFCVIGAAFVGRAVRDSLFLAHLSAQRLPVMYVVSPLVLTAVGLGYARVVTRLRRDRLAIGTAATGGAVMLAARLLLGTGDWIYYVLYVAVNVLSALVIMQLWTAASDRFTARDGKRLFGLIGAGGTLADIAIGAVLAVLAPRIGAENLLYLAAGLLFTAAGLATLLARVAGRVDARPRPAARAAAPELRPPGASHLPLVGACLVCAMVVVTLVEFQFKTVTGAHFGDDRAGMVRYFGAMSIATGVVSLLIQIVATRWLLQRLGVAGALLLLPLGLGVGEVGLLLAPGLIAATMLKMSDETFRFTVNDAASQLLFLPVPSRARGRWKALVDNVWKPGAQVALGFALVAYRGLAPGRITPLVVTALGVIGLWVALLVRLRPAYVDALRATLRRRPDALEPAWRADLGSDGAGSPFAVGGAALPAEELAAERAALTSDEVATVLAALELAPGSAAALVDAVTPLCDHDHPDVRRAACAALTGTAAPSARARLRGRLDDPDAAVRTAALAALLADTGRGSDVDDSHHEAQARLSELCRSPDPGVRIQAADTLAAAGARAADAGATLDGAGELARLLADPDPAVARAAVAACAAVGSPSLARALLRHLQRDQAGPAQGRGAAAEAPTEGRAGVPLLRSAPASSPGPADRWEGGSQRLTPSDPVLGAALAACGAGAEDQLADALADPALSVSARREVSRALGELGTEAAVTRLLGAFEASSPVTSVVLRTAAARAIARAVGRDPTLPFDRARVRRGIDAELAVGYGALAAAEGLGRVESVANSDGTRPAPPFLPDAPEGAAALLTTTLRERQHAASERVLLLIEALYPNAAIDTVAANLREPDPVRRANAAEVLDGVLDRRLRERVLPLLDESPRYARLAAVARWFPTPRQDQGAWIDTMLADDAPWLVACTAHYLGVAGGAGATRRLEPLLGHADQTVRETARVALAALLPAARVDQLVATPRDPPVPAFDRLGAVPMMTTVEKVLLLKGIDLFAAVPADELAAIARIALEVRLEPGELLMSEGEHGDALYFVVAGTARVTKAGRLVAEAGERGVIGELALLDPGPRTATVEATTELTLLRIGRDEFVEILAARPEVPLGVIRMLARRARAALA